MIRYNNYEDHTVSFWIQHNTKTSINVYVYSFKLPRKIDSIGFLEHAITCYSNAFIASSAVKKMHSTKFRLNGWKEKEITRS